MILRINQDLDIIQQSTGLSSEGPMILEYLNNALYYGWGISTSTVTKIHPYTLGVLDNFPISGPVTSIDFISGLVDHTPLEFYVQLELKGEDPFYNDLDIIIKNNTGDALTGDILATCWWMGDPPRMDTLSYETTSTINASIDANSTVTYNMTLPKPVNESPEFFYAVITFRTWERGIVYSMPYVEDLL